MGCKISIEWDAIDHNYIESYTKIGGMVGELEKQSMEDIRMQSGVDVGTIVHLATHSTFKNHGDNLFYGIDAHKFGTENVMGVVNLHPHKVPWKTQSRNPSYSWSFWSSRRW